MRTSDLFVDLLHARFHHGHVGENELGLKRGDVAQRIGVFSEKADNLDKSVVVLHGGEKTRGELRRAAGSFLQSGHIDELDAGVHGTLRREECGTAIKTLIGDFHHADVRVALRHGGGVEMRFRDCLKKRRLA